MGPRVLYHCTCRFGVQPPDPLTGANHQHHPHDEDAKVGEPSTSTLSSITPSLPSQSPAARYSFHPLSHLYFCGDCLTARCHLCAQSEIVTYYCPACLFEVPSASVKSERSRCPRNCFLCPVEGCGSVLQLWTSDVKDVTRLESHEASIGRPPYYLFCLECKWDSKRGMRGKGYVFEKPTGISGQIASQQGTHYGQQEMDKLRSHFESYQRKQTASGLPSSTSYSALGRSKLLRDLPGLENSKYLIGSRKGAAAAALGRNRGPESSANGESLDPYHSDYAASSAAVPSNEDGKTFAGDEFGIMGQREENHRNWIQDLSGHAQNHPISGVEERWRTGWDAGPRADSLDPLRVPLKTKVTLRCPACRHILVKPDPKASSYRWKIKLSALNYLPEISTTFKGVKGSGQSTSGGGSSLSRRESTIARRTSGIGLRDRSGDVRRPQSMFFPNSGGAAGSSSSMIGGGETILDPEKLKFGKTYNFELSFKNPLEDVIAVHLIVVQPPSKRIQDKKESGATDEQEEDTLPTPAWSISLSTSRFTVKPFDDVDIIEEELLGDPRSSDPDDDLEGSANSRAGLGDDHEEAFTSSSKKRKGWEKGVLKKHSNETVIALRLQVSAEREEFKKAHEVEFALLTTITYRLDSSTDTALDSHASSSQERSLEFWNSIRLGKILPAQ